MIFLNGEWRTNEWPGDSFKCVLLLYTFIRGDDPIWKTSNYIRWSWVFFWRWTSHTHTHIYTCAGGSINSHCFAIVGMVINLTVGVYMPIRTIPNIRSLIDPGKAMVPSRLRRPKTALEPSRSLYLPFHCHLQVQRIVASLCLAIKRGRRLCLVWMLWRWSGREKYGKIIF